MKLTRRELGQATAGAAWVALGTMSCSAPNETPDASSETTREESASAPTSRQELLARSIVLDLHCDTPMLIADEGYDLGERHDYGEVDIPRLREGGVSGVFFSIYTSATSQTPKQAARRALEIVDRVIQEVSRHPQDLVLATTADDIVRAKQENRIAILMGVEGGHMIDSSLALLRNLFRLGARYLTLTHNAHTPWADSARSAPVSNGLTDFGRDVVREMNRLGMMVDISHTSDATFFDAIETSRAPIIASHSSCRALAGHQRNLTDEMLKALAQNGGVVHINYYNSFLDDDHRSRSNGLKDLDAKEKAVAKRYSKDAKRLAAELRKIQQERIARIDRVPLARLLDHFEHAAQVAGVDHVGLGSDFDGVSGQLPEGLEDISKMPNLVAGLRERGFSDADIQKILGENTLRVMRAVEGIAQKS